MNADSVYIVNRFAQQGTLKVQMTNVPDTMNVSVTNADIYTESISHIDSVVSTIAEAISASPVENVPQPTDNPITGWAISLIIALMAMAVPLLVNNMNGLDSKYHATRILKLFQHTITYYISMVVIMLTCVNILSIYMGWTDERRMECLTINGIMLLVSLLMLSYKLLIFYDYAKLTNYIQRKYQCELISKRKKEEYFYALTDCLHYAIAQNDKQKTKEVLAFFQDQFKSYPWDKNTRTYPQSYYDFILETTEFICKNDNHLYTLYQADDDNYQLPLSFILKSNYYSELSSKTYAVIWNTLLIYSRYQKYDLFTSFWQEANDFYDCQLEENTLDFVIFCEKVCAMLLAKKQYTVLHKMIYWKECKSTKKTIDKMFSLNFIKIARHHLIELNNEIILLRYIRLINDCSHSDRYSISGLIPTVGDDITLREACKQFMALLYLLTYDKKYINLYYQEEAELFLPDINLESIQNLINELQTAISSIAKDNDIATIFPKVAELSNIPAIPFVEGIKDNYNLHNRIKDMDETKVKKWKSAIQDEVKKAFKDIIIERKEKSSRIGSMNTYPLVYRFIPKELYCSHGDAKKLNEKEREFRTELYCSIIEKVANTLDKITSYQIGCGNKEIFFRHLDDKISKLKRPSKYVIVCDDCRASTIFSGEYLQDNKYKGVEVKIASIYYPKRDSCKIWLLLREDLPNYTIDKATAPLDVHGYKTQSIEENSSYAEKYMLLPLGRITEEVAAQFRNHDFFKENARNVEDYVLAMTYIPMSTHFKMSAHLLRFEIHNIISAENWQMQQDYDDYFDNEVPEDEVGELIANSIITPDMFNSQESKKS